MQTFKVAKIAIEKATFYYDKLYDYIIPKEFIDAVAPGVRVLVPFGRGNQKRTGMVMSICEVNEISKLKPIYFVVDKEPVLNTEGIKLVEFLKNRTFCSYFNAINALLPTGMITRVKYCYYAVPDKQPSNKDIADVYNFVLSKKNGVEKTNIEKKFPEYDLKLVLDKMVIDGYLRIQEVAKRKIQDDTITMVRLSNDDFDSLSSQKYPKKQRDVIDFLTDVYTASVKEVCYYTGVTKTVIDNLQKRGDVVYFEEEVYRNPYKDVDSSSKANITLNEEQEDVYNGILKLYNDKSAQVALLHGITGSGKTEVYLKLALNAVENGKNVIVMVPEIALTPQALDRFHRIFGKKVAVIHSGLSLGQRLDEWKRIKRGEANVVIGTRSAVLAPLDKIGLIVIDEEQEHTYKSELSPRFSTHDVAKFRSLNHNSLLLLTSATPSIESFYQAKNGIIHLFSLKKRYSDAKLPEVFLVDLKSDEYVKEGKVFSETLLDEIRYNLDHNEQTILLLNRRGYSTSATCTKCGETISCPNCSIPLTYHFANNMLMCHYCSHSQPIPQKCPNCDNILMRFFGIGTQKAEAELKEIFSNARILRMDLDTTMSKFSREKYLKDFANKEYDIMIGTQMVAKGLDFPNVTLAGVLSIDSSLYSNDFRAYERSFSLITQAVGRSGRSNLKGRAIIQTYTPDNKIIEMASKQDYISFYEEEIANRRTLLFPPFCDLCVIGFSSFDESLVEEAAKAFMNEMKANITKNYPNLPLNIIGPIPYNVAKVNNKYRYKLVLKCKNTKEFRRMISETLISFDLNFYFKKEVSIFADINPYSSM